MCVGDGGERGRIEELHSLYLTMFFCTKKKNKKKPKKKKGKQKWVGIAQKEGNMTIFSLPVLVLRPFLLVMFPLPRNA